MVDNTQKAFRSAKQDKVVFWRVEDSGFKWLRPIQKANQQPMSCELWRLRQRED